MKGSTLTDHYDNPALSFLPSPGKGKFWRVRDDDPKAPRSKPMKISLQESFRKGSPVGVTVGWEYCQANQKSLTDTAHAILVACADRKKFVGTSGV